MTGAANDSAVSPAAASARLETMFGSRPSKPEKNPFNQARRSSENGAVSGIMLMVFLQSHFWKV